MSQCCSITGLAGQFPHLPQVINSECSLIDYGERQWGIDYAGIQNRDKVSIGKVIVIGMLMA